MTRTITQRELRNDSGAILREVKAGQTIIVSRSVSLRRFVSRAVIEEAARAAPRIDARCVRHDLDVIVAPSVDA